MRCLHLKVFFFPLTLRGKATYKAIVDSLTKHDCKTYKHLLHRASRFPLNCAFVFSCASAFNPSLFSPKCYANFSENISTPKRHENRESLSSKQVLKLFRLFRRHEKIFPFVPLRLKAQLKLVAMEFRFCFARSSASLCGCVDGKIQKTTRSWRKRCEWNIKTIRGFVGVDCNDGFGAMMMIVSQTSLQCWAAWNCATEREMKSRAGWGIARYWMLLMNHRVGWAYMRSVNIMFNRQIGKVFTIHIDAKGWSHALLIVEYSLNSPDDYFRGRPHSFSALISK